MVCTPKPWIGCGVTAWRGVPSARLEEVRACGWVVLVMCLALLHSIPSPSPFPSSGPCSSHSFLPRHSSSCPSPTLPHASSPPRLPSSPLPSSASSPSSPLLPSCPPLPSPAAAQVRLGNPMMHPDDLLDILHNRVNHTQVRVRMWEGAGGVGEEGRRGRRGRGGGQEGEEGRRGRRGRAGGERREGKG